ncbi:MAG: fluoride efflux transporter FluC [Nitrospirota bacterium]
MWSKLFLIAVAGTAGTLSRYWVSGFTYQVLGSKFAYGTLAVNVIGCLLFGFVWALAEDRMAISVLTRTVILVGFMGAFTTFSTFAFETMNYVQDSQFMLAFLNVAANCFLGFGAIVSGVWIARIL